MGAKHPVALVAPVPKGSKTQILSVRRAALIHFKYLEPQPVLLIKGESHHISPSLSKVSPNIAGTKIPATQWEATF